MATPNYDVNYNDERFTKVNNEKTAALSEMEKTYGGMISDTEKGYNDQINNLGVMDEKGNWNEGSQADILTKSQNEQTDFAIEKIEQQKEQAHKDYIKEQSGAYTDWQKQSNPYGVDAEKKADMGMANSGYSESAKVAMYTAYQNRVAVARDVFSRAVLNYDNAIKDAIIQNNATLAKIAVETLEKTATLAIELVQQRNQLITSKVNQKTQVDQMYHERWQDVLAQINEENRIAEEVRQHNEQMAEEKRQFNQNQDLARRQLKAQKENQAAQLALERDKFEWQKAQAAKDDSGGGGGNNKIDDNKNSGGNNKIDDNKNSGGNSNRGGGGGKFGTSSTSAYDALNKMIASGATKDKISNEISLALRNGAITKAEAAKLRSTFTPRGVQY